MTPHLDVAVFDADNHLYETQDAFTRHLPDRHKNLFRFVEINGRKKLVVRDRITEFIPNPTFEVIARPGAHMAFYAAENTEGKTLRELTGEPMRCIPAFREPGPRLELLDEQGIHASLMFPTLASLIEERLRRRSRRSPRSPSTRSTSGCTTTGPSTTRAASSPPRSSTRASSTRGSPSSSSSSSGGPRPSCCVRHR